jgi:hypothetical protein
MALLPRARNIFGLQKPTALSQCLVLTACVDSDVPVTMGQGAEIATASAILDLLSCKPCWIL